MKLTNANESQKNAIMHLRGACLVLAGPGSGKTFTITNRILYLLEQGVPPESILVITFMKEAALSMQKRFQEMAGAGGGKAFYPVNFGTFHSIFYHILRESRALKSSELLKNSEKKHLMIPILKTYEGQQEPSKRQETGPEGTGLDEDAAQILAAIGYYKNTMQMAEAREKAPARWQPFFEAICREYGQAVDRTGRLDFDDMLYNCKRLLQENQAVRSYWQSRFRYILIDEFQDINPVQYEAVKLLAASPYNIFAVGDDDQAIYGFRGSQPECLRRFRTEYRAKQMLLDVNYRSRPEIVQASLAVIEENKDRFEKKLRAAAEPDREGSPVSIKAFSDREQQYGHMLREIGASLQERESCAVLFRTNSYMQGFAARLKSAGIAYEMKERSASIYEHFIAKDIMAYLLLAQGAGKREQMLQVMNRPSRYISREAVGFGEVDFTRMRAYYDRAQMPEGQKRQARDALACFERQLRTVRGMALRLAVSYILKGMGYEEYLRKQAKSNAEKWQEWQELLEWLKEDAAGYGNVEDWRRFQEEYARELERKGEQAEGRHQRKRTDSQAVQLLTVHGAKGLEYDRVWIPDCNEKIFPHGTMPEESAVEEERRIFYVAMTRAKKNLELLYLTGTKERPRQPSRFLNPLLDGAYCPSTSSSNSQLSRYSSKASTTASYSSSSSI